MPAGPGAAFCENCGAELPTAGAAVAGEGAAPVPPPAGSVPSLPPSASFRNAVPAPPAFSAPARTPVAFPVSAAEADEFPFELEWDDARTFVEGCSGVFAFRVAARCDLRELAISVAVDGSEARIVRLADLRRGERREATVDYRPAAAGCVSVSLRAGAELSGGSRETFDAARVPEHAVLPARRYSVQGAGSLTIRVENNTGIVRNDDLNLSALRGSRSDDWNDQREVLSRRGVYRPVAFAPGPVSRESVLLRCAGGPYSELVLVPGSDVLTFGRSSRRAAVRLRPESGAGAEDEARSRFLSGVHFTLKADRGGASYSLFDGGPGADGSWLPSTNGTEVDGRSLPDSGLPVRPGATLVVRPAPYAVPGGAFDLKLETHGSAAPAGGTDQRGALASILATSSDSPRRATLVVWGEASLDRYLGTNSGLAVACRRGRLYFIRPGSRPERFPFLSGGVLPGTTSCSVA